jgi:hypothetical protein
MQVTLDILSYTIVIVGLVFQSIWLIIGRKSRNSYVTDITHFRKPSSYFAQLYEWRLKEIQNPLIEGVLFEVFLVITVIGIGIYSSDFDSLLAVSSLIVLVGLLSFLSALQMTRRAKSLKDVEKSIIQRLKYTENKLESAHNLVEDLYNQGPMSDGRKWFALFKLAQRKDTTGYAIRDALLEKGKKMVKRTFYGSIVRDEETSEPGPGIA